jgi:hypothetical protein
VILASGLKEKNRQTKVALSDYKDVSDYVLSQVKASESDVEVSVLGK